MTLRFMKSALAGLTALATTGCCTSPDFDLGDMNGRVAFSGSLAFDFDFDLDMEFGFDGDFAAWAHLDAATAASLGIDITGKVAYEQELDIDIDDDGVNETVSVIGFGDGDPDDIDAVITAWEGDEYTFDEGYCYVLVWTSNTVTLLTGPCEGEGPLLTCSSPEDDLDDVSCEVCDEDGNCAQCDSQKVSECIDQGADELDDIAPGPQPEPEPVMTDAGAPPDTGEPSASSGPWSTTKPTPEPAAEPEPTPEPAAEPEPEPATPSPEYQACLDQVRALETSVSLCGLSLTLEADALCQGFLSEVEGCVSGVDALGLFDSPCSVLQSDDCSEVVE